MESVTLYRESAAHPPEVHSRGFLEVLDRAGHVVQRIPVNNQPVLIGRAYDNDIILDDPYVSPVHLRIYTSAGCLIAEDLGSANGLYRERERRRVARLELASGKELRIGHTCLRYRDQHFAVPPALIDLASRSPLLLLEKPWVLGLVCLLTLGWLVLGNFLDSFEAVDTSQRVAELVPPVLGIAVWSGVWAFASRLLTHRLNFLIHCAIACLGGMALSFFSVCLSYAAFAFNMHSLEGIVEIIGNALLLSILLYAHLRFCSPASPRRLAFTAGISAVLVCSLLLLETQLGRNDFSATPDYPMTLKPPNFQWTPSEPIADFFDRADALQAQTLEMIESEQ